MMILMCQILNTFVKKKLWSFQAKDKEERLLKRQQNRERMEEKRKQKAAQAEEQGFTVCCQCLHCCSFISSVPLL